MKRLTFVGLILALSLTALLTPAQAQDPIEQIDDLSPPPSRPAAKPDDSDEHRVPPAYTLATGGPDPFGYTYTDSDGGACPYGWVEPGADSRELILDRDDGTAPLPIRFPFPFYGQTYSQLLVDSNGALLLEAGPSDWVNRPLGAGGPTPRLAPFWDDLLLDSASYQVLGDAPHQRLVVTFEARSSQGGWLRFQVLLGQDGQIRFQYRSLSGPGSDGLGASVGIQGPETGLGYLFNGYPQQNQLHAGLAVCFQPPDGAYLSPDRQRGYARAGREVTYTLTAVNQTGADRPFQFSLESDWPARLSPRRATIPDGGSLDLTVTVRVPPGTPGAGIETHVHMAPVAGGIPTSAWLETSRTSNGYGYTGASTSDEAAIFDLQTWTLVDRLSLLPEGDYPYDATIKPDGSEVWIPGASGDGVVVIDTTTNQITHRINVGEYPVSLAFDKAGAYAFVANRDTEDLTVVDTGTYAAVDSIPIPTYYLGAGNVALDPSSGLMYLVDWYGDYLFEFDPAALTVTQELLLGSSLWQLVVNPLGGQVYVTDRGSDVVHVVDTATFSEITTIPTGDDPWGIDITPDGALIYVTNEDSHDLTIIDASDNSVITTIGLPHADADPRDVDFSADGAYAYVTSGSVSGDDQVYVIDTLTHTVAGGVNVAPASNPNVVAVAPQMAAGVELSARKQASPEPVVLGDPLAYAIDYHYTGLISATGVLVTDTLPAGTTYLNSSGGLSSTYLISPHQIVWDLGTVPPGQMDQLAALVLPVDQALAAQVITNQAYLDFSNPGNFSATVWATSSVLAPELAIRLPDGTPPPDPLSLCAGDVVTLTAVTNRAAPLTYTWDLGDGTLADTSTISHAWSHGSYALWLTTTNAYGWVETDTLALEVGHGPAADFASNSPISLGLAAVFTDRSAYAEAWAWDFGDGLGASTEPNPTYTYTQPGAYTVTLTVSNPCGVDTAARPFEVLEAVEPYTVYLPLVLRGDAP